MAVPAQTLAEYRLHVAHCVGGGSLSTGLQQDLIINEAGRYLVSMHPWKWLERVPATLDFTSNTSYVSMPTDFKSLEAIWPDDTLGASFRLTTPDEMAKMRQYEVTLTAEYYGVLVYPSQNSVTVLQTIPRLELYPTPTASTSGALHIWYTRGWTTIDDAADVPNIPAHIETLYTQLVRAFARGYEEDDNGSLDERLKAIADGPIFAACVSQDGMTQHEYGEIRGGWISLNPLMDWNPVSNPS